MLNPAINEQIRIGTSTVQSVSEQVVLQSQSRTFYPNYISTPVTLRIMSTFRYKHMNWVLLENSLYFILEAN